MMKAGREKVSSRRSAGHPAADGDGSIRRRRISELRTHTHTQYNRTEDRGEIRRRAGGGKKTGQALDTNTASTKFMARCSEL